MPGDYFTTDIAEYIWETKYRFRTPDTVQDRTIGDSWRRIARALAAVESDDRTAWAERYYRILEGFRFLPAGRIQAGAGTGREVTLFNCFVMGQIEDSMDGIFAALKQGALTMQQGGGVGYDFSTLRPNGTPARRTGSEASGPVSFMRVWDTMCATLLSTGARRGAMMATLRCDHPDIEAFIDAKRERHELRNFNLSVQVSDALMTAVAEDRPWQLVFPAVTLGDMPGETVLRHWPGYAAPVECRVMREIPARALWQRLMRATYEYAEPGVLFVDRINQYNNLYYRETISACNPCGEVPLPAFGACNLGSLNLTRFVIDPFTESARLDFEAIDSAVRLALRLMDNIIDVSRFPLERQRRQAQGSRRIGLGMTGLGDALIMLGLHYAEANARALAADAMRCICHGAYRASVELARERGAFPYFEPERYLSGAFVARLPQDIREGIAAHGIRNSHLIAIAPTGTISLLANNISSGIEPVYDFEYVRRVRQAQGRERQFHLVDHAVAAWRERHGDKDLPASFVRAWDIAPQAHIRMQAALQPFVDSAISKTINVPADYPFDDFQSLYQTAFAQGLKGCTTFRPNPVTGAVLEADGDASDDARHRCCDIEREVD